mgnify:CR=1 FL=1
MTERRGDTLLFHTPPVIAAQAAVGGKKESEGPLAAGFDELTTDNRLGQRSWEAAEKQLQLRAARLCLQKAALPAERVDLALAGDLQAQCTASGYALRELGVPFAGLFGACSTMAEALALGAALCSSGAAQNLLAMTSSHFCAAERQFRTPLSYGAVRTPTAQWTATAAGCCLLQPQGEGVGIAAATFGRVQDSLSYFVDMYSSIAQWQAVVMRLTYFGHHMHEVSQQAERFHVERFAAADVVEVNDMKINLPDGKPLLENISFTLHPGCLLYTSPSPRD